MHSAPAVSYPVGRSHFQGYLIVLVALCGAVLLVAWVAQADTVGARHVGIAVLYLLLTLWSVRQWLRVVGGTLAWDGLCWTWTMAGEAVVVVPAVTLDSQSGLLLCLHPQTGRCYWVWPERRLASTRWLAFRRAVFGKIATPEVAGVMP